MSASRKRGHPEHLRGSACSYWSLVKIYTGCIYFQAWTMLQHVAGNACSPWTLAREGVVTAHICVGQRGRHGHVRSAYVVYSVHSKMSFSSTLLFCGVPLSLDIMSY